MREKLLQLLRLPPEPPAPFGEEESLRVFRASPQYLKYQIVIWAIGQITLVVFSLLGLIAVIIAAFATKEPLISLIMLVAALVLLALVAAQLLISYLCVQLVYEMRWYKVTDRSLRIREGVFFVREMTMTFVNIQNIQILQGPIQRWLGIYDVKVETAGGGGAVAAAGHGGAQHQLFNMHTGYFRGVDNAAEIVALMQERLRRSRSAGLGDPDDPDYGTDEVAAGPASPQVTVDDQDTAIVAARSLLDEVRLLRGTLTAVFQTGQGR